MTTAAHTFIPNGAGQNNVIGAHPRGTIQRTVNGGETKAFYITFFCESGYPTQSALNQAGPYSDNQGHWRYKSTGTGFSANDGAEQVRDAWLQHPSPGAFLTLRNWANIWLYAETMSSVLGTSGASFVGDTRDRWHRASTASGNLLEWGLQATASATNNPLYSYSTRIWAIWDSSSVGFVDVNNLNEQPGSAAKVDLGTFSVTIVNGDTL